MLLTIQYQSKPKGSLQKGNGAVVQPVRIQACHAWGRGFESRPHRRGERKSSMVNFGFLLLFFQTRNKMTDFAFPIRLNMSLIKIR